MPGRHAVSTKCLANDPAQLLKRALWLSFGLILALGCGLALKSTAAQAKPSPKKPGSFPSVIQKTANTLFKKAPKPEASGAPLEIVLDPIIDGRTGQQTGASNKVHNDIKKMIRKNYPGFTLKPFTPENLARSPFLMIGTLTAIGKAGQATGPRKVIRLCLRLASLKTGKVVSTAVGFAKPKGMRLAPVGSSKDAPVFSADEARSGYADSCHTTKMGSPMKKSYLAQLDSAALINSATNAYNKGRYEKALALYQQAKKLPGGDQLRVYNGLYLANQRLERYKPARKAFTDLVDYGIKHESLSVKFLFKANSTQFRKNKVSPKKYEMWLKQIARRVARSNKCIEVVGHTSHTGGKSYNERLSMQRAEEIEDQLTNKDCSLARRMDSDGVGWTQNLVGTGRDDASDALDRRVEIKLKNCQN